MEYLDIALETASKSNRYYQHGALLIKNGRIISEGFNDFNLHAEVSALLNVYRILRSKSRKGEG